jgi:predicted ATPase/DNA-binding SARP family transcriptional activator
LLLHRNELVSTDRLLEEIWGDSDPQEAVRSLQVYVSQVRKLLGGGTDVLRTGEGGYSLALEDEQLDAARFERLVHEGRQALIGSGPESAAERLSQALALWRGPPLADLAYENFAQAEITRLDELRLVAVESRIQAELELGHHDDLVGELEALVAEQPLRERPRGQLMLALYRSGRQADALSAYQDARRTLLDELGLEPSPELKELEAAILRQDPALAVEPAELRARRHLPAPATALVGRTEELAEVATLLRLDSPRLLTLTGAGGTGKTRLALQAASDVVDRFADGVFFVGLAPLTEPELVVSAIAQALGIPEGAEQPRLESLKEHIRERRLLIVVDNFEHVDEAAPVVSELLADASGLKVLVTSRMLLHLYGEHEYPVPPLMEEEAVELFATRARAARRTFELDGTTPDVLELCRSLDCLPLAIELAAARSGQLTPAQMLDVLPHRLELATRGARDLPARQQTLRATIEWSYELLDDSGQELFARLAVFAGGWSLEAAESVYDADLDALASLVEKSLVVETEQADGETRFAMLETIREYALEQLAARADADEIRRRHAQHFLDLSRSSEGIRRTPAEWDWMDTLDRERGNLRAALDWWAEHDGRQALALVEGAYRFWYERGHFDEGRRAFERALAAAQDVDPIDRARALGYTGAFAFALGDFERAETLAEEMLAVYRETDDPGMIARALVLLGTIRNERGTPELSVPLLDEAVELAHLEGDDVLVSFTTVHLSLAMMYAGDYVRARRTAEEAVAQMRRVGDRGGEQDALSNLGTAQLLDGDERAALESFASSLELAVETHTPIAIANGVQGVAEVAARRGDVESAARLLAACKAFRDARELRLEAISSRTWEESLAHVRAALDGRALAAASAAGAELSLDEAVAEAFATAERLRLLG